MDGLHFIYFADPMCSWCWGFAPVARALNERYAEVLPIRLVMGGLRPGTDRPMTAAARREIRTHWDHVREAAGQPFDYSILDREDFIYDTDPAARAVVLVRRGNPSLALPYLERVQQAFYAEGRDVTDPAVLADLAGEFGFDQVAFLEGLSTEELKFETWRDYATSQRAGVTGFPTLIVGPNTDGTFALVSQGFQPGEPIIASIDRWLGMVQPAEA
ncbi:MAG: DsbA family protein [Caulobacterales bacterium]